MQAGDWWEIALNIISTQKSYNPYANSMWAKMGENATLQHRSRLKTLQIDFDDKTKDRGLPWRRPITSHFVLAYLYLNFVRLMQFSLFYNMTEEVK